MHLTSSLKRRRAQTGLAALGVLGAAGTAGITSTQNSAAPSAARIGPHHD